MAPTQKATSDECGTNDIGLYSLHEKKDKVIGVRPIAGDQDVRVSAEVTEMTEAFVVHPGTFCQSAQEKRSYAKVMFVARLEVPMAGIQISVTVILL